MMTCEQQGACYPVYAHNDHELYRIDLAQKSLVHVGSFDAPMVSDNSGKKVEDAITDLAVAPDNTIYVISRTTLYTASSSDGHVTTVGAITACGDYGVALTFTPNGKLYTADHLGAFCEIDLSSTPPQVMPVGTIGGGMALSGDLVAVGDGTMYGTAYHLTDTSGGTHDNNLLLRINPATGQQEMMLGATGFPTLFGAAYAMGEVFGFTHDGSGDVVTIDPVTGKGTLYKSFKDSNGKGIAFAGAGVNSKVAPTIN